MEDNKAELKGKKLLVLGGSLWKKDIKDFCVQNEISIIAAGNDPTSGINEIADEYCNVDSTDVDAMIRLVDEKKIDGVFSCTSEEVIPFSIKYTTESGLYSYATIQQWNTLMNKRNMKRICSQYGIDTIPEYSLKDIETGDMIEYPVIVKPVDSSGSRGISVCTNEEELKQSITYAQKNARYGDVVIESYIVAPFWQMEIYVQDGIPYFGFTKERVFYPSLNKQAKQPFLDIYPSRYDERIRSHVFPKFSQMIVDLGIRNASVWVQGFITSSCAYVFDVGFRLGGGMENRVMALEKGVDNIKSHISFALTGKWSGDYSRCLSPFKDQYITMCVGLKNGRVNKIEGIETLRSNPYVFDIIQYYKEGDVVSKSGLYMQTLIRIFIKGYTGNLQSLINTMVDCLRVVDDEGNDMLLPLDELEWDNELKI